MDNIIIPPIWTHPVLLGIRGLIHGTSTRGLSLGLGAPDTPEVIYSRRAKFLRSLSLDPKSLIIPEQTHGNKVGRVKYTGQWFAKTDGLVTDVLGITLGIVTADCTPIFLVEPHRKILGFLHAGKKGTLFGIAKEGVTVLINEWNLNPSNLIAVIGPSIGPCCYDFDLWDANYQQLKNMGVRHIYSPCVCTGCDLKTWYSYHKENGKTGKMLSVLGFRF